ncbi:hypothetical protein RA086_02310 [Lactiplantibacillus sp. WILCCON 0030]|uniref:Uncharacterized protein n=1 Tax=Lactiplantibacillus brownii TaxID=3069269 RepID=A0ABU1A6G6_9LACO|nr:hypothetical protein [Lactiplantibacillus brownii]MDQ7936478.1 hypothetical protein [Lactiplantibacillus brownii]
MNLNDDDKTCLIANIVAGYEEGRFEAGVQNQLNQLLGYQVEPSESCYQDLLSLYFKLGGGAGIKNLSGLDFSHDDYIKMVKLDNRISIETYVRQRFGSGLTVTRTVFDTFVVY